MGTNITFCGAGFLGIYHIGVVSCFKFYAKKLLDKINYYGGCSAGALAACMLICDLDLEECVKFVMHQASKVHSQLLGPMSLQFDPSAEIRKSSLKYLPPNAYERATGKLYISLTRVCDWKNVVVSEYSSNSDLVDALVCTCFIPFLSGIVPPKYKGVAYIDGGFTDNLPQQFEGITITVSPFGGENDICPNDRHKSNSQFDLHNTNIQFSCHNLYRMSRALFPPNNDVLIKMCCEGFNDALKYLHKNYAEMLCSDMAIVSIPKCCDFALTKEKMEDTVDNLPDVCPSCGNESDSSFNEAGHQIAIEKVLGNFVFPEELSQILEKTKLFLEEDNLNWYVARALTRTSEWIVKPCQYSSKQMMTFSKRVIKSILPKLKWAGSYNYYTQKFVDYASKGFHAYKETAQYEWHPSIREDNQIHIQKRKEILKSSKKSFIALPSKTFCTENELEKDCCATDTPWNDSIIAGSDRDLENKDIDDEISDFLESRPTQDDEASAVFLNFETPDVPNSKQISSLSASLNSIVSKGIGYFSST